MSSFLLKLKLINALLIFISSLFIIKLRKAGVGLTILFFALTVGFSCYDRSVQTISQISTEQNKPIVLSPTLTHISLTMTPEKVATSYTKIIQMQKQYAPQRDLLFNASLLAKSLGLDQESELYRASARTLDPNSQLFKE